MTKLRSSSHELQAVSGEFPGSARETWRQGRYDLLTDSQASSFLKRILVEKVTNRNKSRGNKPRTAHFFGEAWVVAKLRRHREGWYGSFKWLTHADWARPGWRPDESYKQQYKAALDEHFPSLAELQSLAGRIVGLPADKTPSEPDLWLIGRDGTHHFIEVKIHPQDEASQEQVAGLALIGHHLTSHALNVSVEVVTIFEEGRDPPPAALAQKYAAWYDESYESARALC